MGEKLSSYTRPECEFFRRECNFTPEELNVFDLSIRDRSVVYISMELSMSESTVKRKLRNIRTKIGKVR